MRLVSRDLTVGTFCWTPNQMSLLKDESLKRVLFLSPPSCGKTFILKGKVKQLALKNQKVLILLPCYLGIQTLLFFHLKEEFEYYNNYIQIDNVKANGYFSIDETDLLEKIEKYRDHHIFMDEVGIFSESDIALIRLAQKSTTLSLWISVTYMDHADLENKLKLELTDFLVLKDELNLPLRNTASITMKAYNINKGVKSFDRNLGSVCFSAYCLITR